MADNARCVMHLHLSAACTCAWRLLFGVNHLSRSRCAIPRCPMRESTHKSLHRVYKIVDRTWRKRTNSCSRTKVQRDETKHISSDYARSHADATQSTSCRYSTSTYRPDSLILTNVTQWSVKQWIHVKQWNCETQLWSSFIYFLFVSYSMTLLEY